MCCGVPEPVGIAGKKGLRRDMMDDSDPKTTTVLTVELPTDLDERLRSAVRRDSRRTIPSITLEALGDWLDRDEKTATSRSAAA